MKRGRSQRLLSYYVAVVAMFAISAGALLLFSGTPRWQVVVSFWMVHSLAHWPPIEVRVGAPQLANSQAPRLPVLSAGFVVLLTAAFVAAPSEAFMLGLLSPIAPGNWRGLSRSIFNSAQAAIYVSAASIAVGLVSGPNLEPIPLAILGALAASALAIVLNSGLVGRAIAFDRGMSFGFAWKSLLWPSRASLVMGAIGGLLVASVYQAIGVLGMAFFLAPVVVLRVLRKGRAELDLAQLNTLRALVRAVELKDPYTLRHSERVAAIVVELMREAGCAEDALESAYTGALLHDVGKAAVDAAILTKPGKLTEWEFAQIQEHPDIGARVVEEITFLADVVPLIRLHHERMDGSGYPQGLRGAAIPWTVRVLAVADTFEALTSDRPYRRALSFSAALSEIERCTPDLFDVEVVSSLRRIIVDGGLAEKLSTVVHLGDEPERAPDSSRSATN